MYMKGILEEFELEYCSDKMLPADIDSFENLIFYRTEKNWRDTNCFRTEDESL